MINQYLYRTSIYLSNYCQIITNYQLPIHFLMKKLLSVINIQQANECSRLETDYKIQRKNLKRYQESLKIFKIRLSQNVYVMETIHQSLHGMHQSQSKSRKKTSEIQYYMFNGVKVFGSMIGMFTKSSQFYSNLLKKLIHLQTKIEKTLEIQKKTHKKNSQTYESHLKSYSHQCYPSTSSFLFLLNLTSANSLQKKPDSFLESTLISQSKLYSQYLSSCLEEIQSLRKQIMEISQKYYEGARDMWIWEMDQIKDAVGEYGVDQGERERIAEETGRVLTGRSDRSERSQPEDKEGIQNKQNNDQVQGAQEQDQEKENGQKDGQGGDGQEQQAEQGHVNQQEENQQESEQNQQNNQQ